MEERNFEVIETMKERGDGGKRNNEEDEQSM